MIRVLNSCLAGVLLALLAAPALAAQSTPCGGHGTQDSMVVSTGWLQQHLHDSDLVILAMDQAGFRAAHIPGAQPFTYMDTHQMQANGLTLEMMPPQATAAVFARLGVSNRSRVVLYRSAGQFAQLARVYTTLDAIGMGANTAILDGGWEAWTAEHRPTTSEFHAAPRGDLAPCPQAGVVVRFDDVFAALRRPGITIVDARAPQFYTGADHAPGQRSGHIPGARNVPFTEITTADGKLKTNAQLAALFAAAGVPPGDRIIAYCHIGQQANAVYFAARLLGRDVSLYDGSWEDWSRHQQAPAEPGR